jgi:hypothetical protein
VSASLVTWRRQPRLGFAEVFAAIFALSFLVARFVPVLAFGWVCPLKGLAGIPCATCGMTHAFVALAYGRLAAAWAASPLGAIVAACAWLFALADGARLAAGAPFPEPAPRVWRVGVAAGLVAVLVNWAWLLVREGRA